MKLNPQTVKPRGYQCPHSNRWHVRFPDLPDAKGECATLDGALAAAHKSRDSLRAGGGDA